MRKSPVTLLFMALLILGSCTGHKMILSTNQLQHEQVLSNKTYEHEDSNSAALKDTDEIDKYSENEYADTSKIPEIHQTEKWNHDYHQKRIEIIENTIKILDSIPGHYNTSINNHLYNRFRVMISALMVIVLAMFIPLPLYTFLTYSLLSLMGITIGLGLILYFSQIRNEANNPEKISRLAKSLKDFGTVLLFISPVLAFLSLSGDVEVLFLLITIGGLALIMLIYGSLYDPKPISDSQSHPDKYESCENTESGLKHKAIQIIVAALVAIGIAALWFLLYSDPIYSAILISLFIINGLLAGNLFATSQKNDEQHTDYLNYITKILRVSGRCFIACSSFLLLCNITGAILFIYPFLAAICLGMIFLALGSIFNPYPKNKIINSLLSVGFLCVAFSILALFVLTIGSPEGATNPVLLFAFFMGFVIGVLLLIAALIILVLKKDPIPDQQKPGRMEKTTKILLKIALYLAIVFLASGIFSFLILTFYLAVSDLLESILTFIVAISFSFGLLALIFALIFKLFTKLHAASKNSL